MLLTLETQSPSVRARLTHAAQHLYELPGDQRRSAALQGLRGLGAALVFFVHYNTLFAGALVKGSFTQQASRMAGHVGHSGVDLFFVLSGFLIYRMCLRRVAYGDFLVRRLRRLYPAFLCVFAIYTALAIALPEYEKFPRNPQDALVYWLANLALLPGVFPIAPLITVAWSLSYEVFFYLTLPLLTGAIGLRHRAPGTRLTFLCVLAVVGFVLAGIGWLPHIRMLMFVCGMLCAELCARPEIADHLDPRRQMWVLAAFAASFPAILVFGHPQTHSGISWNVPVVVTLFLVHGAIVVCGISTDGPVARLFSLMPLRWMGNISYSFYLVHGLILNGLSMTLRFGGASMDSPALFWAMLPVAWVCALLGSSLLFAFVERPFSLSAPVRFAQLRQIPSRALAGVPVSDQAPLA